jgi:hypothetical protein
LREKGIMMKVTYYDENWVKCPNFTMSEAFESVFNQDAPTLVDSQNLYVAGQLSTKARQYYNLKLKQESRPLEPDEKQFLKSYESNLERIGLSSFCSLYNIDNRIANFLDINFPNRTYEE